MTVFTRKQTEVARSPWRGPRVLRRAEFWITGAAILLIGYLVAAPLIYLIWQAFTTRAGLTISNFIRAFQAPGTGEMITNSVIFAVGQAIMATLIGTSLAYFCVRTNAPMKPLLYAASLVPLIIPGILFTISWIFLLSKDIGVINQLLESAGLGFLTLNIFSLPGMILVDGLHLSPIVFLLMFAAFRATDPSLEESALMSGASLPTVFRRVTLPLVRPALMGAMLVMLVRGLESFETPALLGIPARKWVFTSQIYQALNTYPVRYDLAGVYSLTLLAITALGLFYVQWANRQSERYQTVTGKGFRPRPLDLGKWRWPVSIVFVLYFLIVVVAPLLILIWVSLLPFYMAPSFEALDVVSLENYGRVFNLRNVTRSLKNSLLLAVSSATFLMLFMSVVSYIVLKTRMPGRRLLDLLSAFPLAYPGLVLGVAFIFIYLRSPIPIYGTLWILFLVYITRYMPYGMRYASTSMSQISNELEESAKMSGARWSDTFRRIILPLVTPGLLAGWVYVMIVSVRELSSSILLYRSGTEVFSVIIWQLWNDGFTTVLAAVGTMMVFGLVIMVAIAYKLGAKVGVQVE